MALSPGLKKFWVLIGGISAVGCSLAITLICWKGLIAGGIAAAIVMMLVSTMLGSIQLQLVKAVTTPPKATPCDLSDHQGYDEQWFEHHTRTLEDLGFQILTDCHLKAQSTTVAKFFYHSEHQCFAELLQSGIKSSVTSENNLIYRRTIVSCLNPDWTIIDFDRANLPLDGLSYMWRNPQEIRNYRSTESLREMLTLHLNDRHTILHKLKTTVRFEPTWEEFQAYEAQVYDRIRKTLMRRNLLVGLFEATLYEFKPKTTWLGDCGKRHGQRTGKGSTHQAIRA
jgi:hypothetical protein